MRRETFLAVSENLARCNLYETGKRGFGGSTVMRKRLADISNLPQQSKAANRGAKRQQQTFTKEYVEKIRKEKEALSGLLAERDSIIESSSSELENMRVTSQKLQQQNLQLAQANSQMLAELNLGKERLRTLQHELGCQKGILKARELELERKAQSEICKKNEEPIVNINEAVELSQADKDDGELSIINKRKRPQMLDYHPDKQMQVEEKTDNKRIRSRRHSASFESNEIKPYGDMSETGEDKIMEGKSKNDAAAKSFHAGAEYSELHISKLMQQPGNQPMSSSSHKRVQAKEKNDEKRICSTRQSARLKTKDLGPRGDTFEMDSSQIPLSDLPVSCNSLTSSSSSVKIEDDREDSVPIIVSARVGRPSRQAARKVQSYKEIPLNVKMRRPD